MSNDNAEFTPYLPKKKPAFAGLLLIVISISSCNTYQTQLDELWY